MTTFPLNPTNGLTHSINDRVWSWNGYAWEKTNQSGGGGTGPAGPTGPTGPAGADGAGGGGATLSAGDGLTLSPVVAGVGYTMSVDFNGAATNQVLYHDGTGFSGDNSVLFAQDANHPHLEADIEGKLLKAIKADEALAALDPVYITGNVGASDRVTVGKADASDPTKMPAAGIVTGAFSTNDEGYMVVAGLVRQADTSGFAANDTAYVGVGGGITAARPSGATDLIQNLGRVGRVHASTGTLLVLGAGRANDTPNLIHARAGISSDAGITANAPCNFLDNQVIRPQLKDYSETVNAIGSKTTSFSVDFEDGNVQSLTVGS